ncbi:MAG: hypothetical protein V7L11_18400 [Nostoc sp.]|uniref:hypothetical protein n=1 Tax=Nostoc sp. TaxID=1180 RepID=UPI002FFA8C8B
MANIKINNLNTAGSDLFNDSESFLNELTDSELNMTQGGSSIWCAFSAGLFQLTGRAYQVGRLQRRNDNACYPR